MYEMESILSNIFSFFTGILNPVTTLLIGFLLTKIEDVLFTLNVLPEGEALHPRKANIIRLIRIIGILMIIVAGIKLLRLLIGAILYIFQLIM